MVVVKDSSNKMPGLLKAFTAPMPKWLNHIAASAFLHQDALFLHGQERSLSHNKEYRTAEPARDSYAKAVLPTSADKGVMNFRNWMSQYAGGFIPFKGDTSMPAANNEVCLVCCFNSLYNACFKSRWLCIRLSLMFGTDILSIASTA
jgi:hypothetical protein